MVNTDFIIIHNRLNWFWAGRLRWTNDIKEATVYRTRQGADRACNRLNKRYYVITAQYLTLDDYKAMKETN